MQHEAVILMGLLSTWLELVGVGKTSEVPAICRIPKDPGPCSENDLRFFYDIENQDCKTFLYGGCGGNANHFRSREECMQICEVRTDMNAITTTPAPTEPPENVPQICKLPKSPGSCSEKLLRFYYDLEHEICKAFLYSGCGGNANHFPSIDECMDICKVLTSIKNKMVTTTTGPPTEDVPQICKLPKNIGSCSEKLLRFYYDLEHEICKAFLYSGCGGNANLFPSIDECMDICKVQTSIKFKKVTTTTRPPTEHLPNVCRVPKDHGPCSKIYLRFYYDLNNGKCKIYGGCGSSANHFRSMAQCKAICENKRRLES